MAASPKWKVFDRQGAYVASCKEIAAAACLMGFYGDGATIRAGHDKSSTVWTEGADGRAADSYDAVAELAATR